MAAAEVVRVTVEERVVLPMGRADPEVVVHRTLEVAPLLSYRAMNLGEEGVEGGGAFGWEEGGDFEVQILEASQVTPVVGSPCITRWMRLTLKSSSGVSLPNVL